MSLVAALITGGCIIAPAASAPGQQVDQRPSMGIRYLQPVTEQEVARFGEIPHLAAPQQLFIEEAFKRYQALAKARVQERLPALDTLSRDTAEAYLARSPTSPELIRQLNASEAAVTQTVARLDAGFLARSSPSLQRTSGRRWCACTCAERARPARPPVSAASHWRI